MKCFQSCGVSINPSPQILVASNFSPTQDMVFGEAQVIAITAYR